MRWPFLDYNRKPYYDPKPDNKIRLGDWYTQKGGLRETLKFLHTCFTDMGNKPRV